MSIIAGTLSDADIADPSENPHVARVAQFAPEHRDSDSTVICAKLESDLVGLSEDEARENSHGWRGIGARKSPDLVRIERPVFTTSRLPEEIGRKIRSGKRPV